MKEDHLKIRWRFNKDQFLFLDSENCQNQETNLDSDNKPHNKQTSNKLTSNSQTVISTNSNIDEFATSDKNQQIQQKTNSTKSQNLSSCCKSTCSSIQVSFSLLI